MKRAPTVSDVAALAGVSPKTVSRALNGEANVRPEKVARVRKAAAELGFRPNEFARLLRTRGTTKTIGVVTADVGDPFWTGVLRGVEQCCGQGDQFILSASTRDRSEREAEIVAAMVERRVMAVLVVPTATDQSYLAAIQTAGTPVVCIDRPAVGADVDAVVADDVGGAERGVRLLIERGHRRIAFLATPSIYTTAQRLAGFRAAHAAAGIEVDARLVHPAVVGVAEVTAVVDELLAGDDPPTAVFSSNVATSVGVLGTCKTRGWRPGVVAFSDFDAAAICEPPVTVIHNDPVELGRRAAALTVDRLEGYAGPARRECIGAELILRESHLAAIPGHNEHRLRGAHARSADSARVTARTSWTDGAGER